MGESIKKITFKTFDHKTAVKRTGWRRSYLGCPSKLVSIWYNRNSNRKLVLALSETKGLFRSHTETESFGISVEPKQTAEQPKQFDRNHIFVFFTKFRIVSVLSKQRVLMFRLNRNKQKTNRNILVESIFWYFSENFGLFRFGSKQFCLFQLFRYRF